MKNGTSIQTTDNYDKLTGQNKTTEDEFHRMLKDALKENLSVSLSVGNSYGYGDEVKVLTVHLMFNNETICNEEISLK